MFIVTVIPIARGVGKEELSYFSPVSYEEGAVIKIPVRKKEVPALVLASSEVRKSKAEVKSLHFGLKKLPTQYPLTTLPHALIRAAEDTARFYATTRGAVIYAVLPSFAKEIYPHVQTSVSHRTTSHHCLQGYREDRYEQYRHIVRETFAQKESVFITSPERHTLEELKASICPGIEEHVFVLSSDISKKKQIKLWQAICEHNHPVVVIATPHYVTIPRYDFSLFIIDKENTDTYILGQRPFIDMRYFIKRFAFHSLASVLVADILLRAETYDAYNDKKINQYRPFSWKYRDTLNTQLLDLTTTKSTTKASLELFAPETLDILKKKEKALVYVSRKGTYPLTQCEDCASIVNCTTCEYPLVLYRHQGKTLYVCHICNRQFDTHILCQNCKSWRLKPLGIGIRLVKEHIRELLPKTPLYVIDSTTAKTPKDIREILETFKNANYGILLTTQKGLSYINEHSDSVIVVSIDPLFAIPDLKMNERIMKLLLELKSRAQKNFIIQTRHGNISLMKKALDADTERFFKEELKERKQFEMPPYSRLIKISWTGTTEALKKGKGMVHALLEAYRPEYYMSFFKTPKGYSILNALIKVDRALWPDQEILERLKKLPPSMLVQVDPNTLL